MLPARHASQIAGVAGGSLKTGRILFFYFFIFCYFLNIFGGVGEEGAV